MTSTNPYKLPEGDVQIAFSGGRTSAFMLHKILQANGDLPERVKVMFLNTGRELPETIEFIADCRDKWGVEITFLEYDVTPDNKSLFKVVSIDSLDMNGLPFDKLIDRSKSIPRAGLRFCTGQLKIDTPIRYLKDVGWNKWTVAIGIRYDEPRRIKPNRKKYMTNWYPMFEAKHTNEDVLDFWSKQNFDLKLPSINGRTVGGNCDFCFLKSEASLVDMYRKHPERAQWWIDAEKRTGKTFRDKQSYESLFDFIDKQADWVFDDEDFFCQKDGGECTG